MPIRLAQDLSQGPAVHPGDSVPKLSPLCEIDDQSPCKITTLDGLTTSSEMTLSALPVSLNPADGSPTRIVLIAQSE